MARASDLIQLGISAKWADFLGDDIVRPQVYGALGDGTHDDTFAVQSAIDNANSVGGTVLLAAGTYPVSTLDLRGKYLTIVGAGMAKTIIKANSSVSVLVNASESSNVIISPLVMSGMTIDSNSLAATGLDIRYRHHTDFTDMRFTGATSQNVKAKDTWLMRMGQVLIDAAPIGLWLVGSNHRSKFDSLSVQNCTTWHIKAESAGTAGDGNYSLEFSNCDVESGTGGGVYLDIVNASFRSCYLGEVISGPVVQVQAGYIQIDGGTLFIGYTTNTIGVVANGGNTYLNLNKVKINGQNYADFAHTFSGSGVNAVRFNDCHFGYGVTGDSTVAGDLLDYGPQGRVFATRLGKNFISEHNNTSSTDVVTGNSQKCIVTAAPGPNPILGMKTPLISNAEWFDGGNVALVVTYESTQTMQVRFSGNNMGVSPTVVIGTLPATTGAKNTYLTFGGTLSNAAYTILEFIQYSSSINDFITIYDCFLCDRRMLQSSTSGGLGNLYKC